MIKKQVGVAAVVFALTGALGVAPAFAVSGGEVSECVPVDAVYETVVISEAGWQRYSFNGRWDFDEAPKFPGDRWQRNTASDPHKVGVAGAYFRSSGNSGKGDWFYLEEILAVTEKVLVSEAVVCNPVVPDPVVPDPVVVPVQPADRTVRTVLYSDIECFDGWVEDVVQVETFSTRYDSDSNSWVEYLAGVTEVRENNRPPTVEQCDPVIELPVEPVVPVVPEPTPEPVVPVEPEPVVPVVPEIEIEPTPEPEMVVQPTPVDAVPTVATPATLAVTGSTNTVPAMLLALLLTLTGLMAVVLSKLTKPKGANNG